MTTGDKPPTAASTDPVPAGAAPAPVQPGAPPRPDADPTLARRLLATVATVCLLLAVLAFLVAGTCVASALVRNTWASDVPAVPVPEKPDESMKRTFELQAQQTRRQFLNDQRTAALTSGAALAGVGLALLSVSLMLGALRPERPAVERLVALVPGIIVLIGAVVVIVSTIPSTSPVPPQTGYSPFGIPPYGASAVAY